jgi:hypothetical protein
VGALTIVSGVAIAQLDHGSGHDMHGAQGHAMKAGHHEMMKDHMGKAGHDMKSHAGKAGHDMKNHAGEAGHE